MYLLAPLILQNFKKFLQDDPQIFLAQTIIFPFIYLLALFTMQNFKNILPVDPEL